MAAVMDLDLNCPPPPPEPAAQDDLRCSTLRQQLFFRDQVKDLHSLYWSRNNLMDVPPFRNHSSDALPYAHHPSHMVDLGATHNPGVFRHCHDLGNQAPRCRDEITWENLDVKGSILRKPNPCSAQGRSTHHRLIDLEKPAALDDDVEIVSSTAFTSYANHNVGLFNNSQSLPLESSPLVRDRLCSAPYITSGLAGSSDSPDSSPPVRAKDGVSGRMCIDLNVAQEDDSNICPEPSIASCSLVASSATRHSGDFSNNSRKTFLKGSESSIGSSKGSSVTVVTTISPPYSSMEVMAAGVFRDTTQSHKPLLVEASKCSPIPIRNIHHQHAEHTISGLDSQGWMEIPRTVSSVLSNGENNSSLGLPKLGGSQATNLMGQPAIAVHRELQEENITVISDDAVEDFDLNVTVEIIDFPSKVTTACARSKPVNNDRSEENSSNQYATQNEVRQNVPSVECATIRDQHMVESRAGEDVQSPRCGITTDRCVFIPEGRDYASPRLRSSNIGVSLPPEAVSIHDAEVGEDEKNAAMAADTLVSIFTANSAWMTDSHGSNSQTDGGDGRHEPAPSMNSFEESILGLEDMMRDDGESIGVRPPDKDGVSCGIKLKRGRGLRDFQREILPGLVSLARHEICDDLHAIGYEMRKTRPRRSFGDGGTPPTRTRLSRRCSTAWNRDV
ncbi:hypothetical protein SETIT_9G577000v2 [Setaria italica]|uniref:Uncharacterized protein n=1 Tax=Setaria italica TaxID=4555 RepID=A0A368SXA0_SETIT|nr:uncharacterized protein LOC101770295 [Setaria italica]RCV47013.1 hypothetical protein SETIT_9G577000v2 [Setaria italica]RCV47014.1 hypothetical protein SETIT_9G577000v2 [Setaria italica]